jgi:hypothetical protein
VGELVRHHVAVDDVALPLGEIAGLAAVLARLLMLEAERPHLVAEREQDVEVREMTRSEQAIGLANDAAMDLDLLVAGGQ